MSNAVMLVAQGRTLKSLFAT